MGKAAAGFILIVAIALAEKTARVLTKHNNYYYMYAGRDLDDFILNWGGFY